MAASYGFSCIVITGKSRGNIFSKFVVHIRKITSTLIGYLFLFKQLFSRWELALFKQVKYTQHLSSRIQEWDELFCDNLKHILMPCLNVV